MSTQSPGKAPPAQSPTSQALASWNERHQRAMKLLAHHPQAAPLLEFLLDLLGRQRELYHWASSQDWLAAVTAPEQEFPRLKLERLPLDALAPRFGSFVEATGGQAPEVLKALARRLGAAGETARRALLEAFLARATLEEIAAKLACDPRQAEFFPRAFVQPLAEWLARALGAPPEQWHESFCPHCGRLPQLAILRDDALIRNRRLLECALCRTQWPFRRAVCPHCGESQSEKLEFHSPEDFPHLRVEECHTCRAYFKTIDLRKNGLAVPVIEEIASVELDLWADERGLWKLQPNVLGL